MMSLYIFGLTKCSTCQKALAWLDDEGVTYDFTDVKESIYRPDVNEGSVIFQSLHCACEVLSDFDL